MNKEKKLRQKEILKQARIEHADTVAIAQELLKQQKALRKPISKVIKDEAHTVPEIAAATGLDPCTVFWQITAMRKYDQVIQKGMEGEYFAYQLVKGKKK